MVVERNRLVIVVANVTSETGRNRTANLEETLRELSLVYAISKYKLWSHSIGHEFGNERATIFVIGKIRCE
jgi:hypothetical protein